MQLIRGLINLNHQADDCVATIGNFDGVHLGHRAIIQRVTAHAQSYGHKSCVIVFEPHPKEVFLGMDSPARVMSFTEKFETLSKLGVDKLLVLKFNKALCEMPARDFIQTVLVDHLRIKHLVVGDDFQFGYKRQGNYELLKSYGKGLYTVEPTPSILVSVPLEFDGNNTEKKRPNKVQERVSSTLVRKALAENRFHLASTLLTQPYRISGKVVYGKQLGQTIGFPTANIALSRKKPAVTGVFLVEVTWKNDLTGNMQVYFGVANCGLRPTVEGSKYRLEVHLLDYQGDTLLYGLKLNIKFEAFVRKEQKFESIQALKEQIAKDVSSARRLIDEN